MGGLQEAQVAEPLWLWDLLVIGFLMGVLLSRLSLGVLSFRVLNMVSCGVSYGLFSKHVFLRGLILMSTYRHIWICMVTYVSSDSHATLIITYKHIGQYGKVWLPMAFPIFASCTYGHKQIHMDRYG